MPHCIHLGEAAISTDDPRLGPLHPSDPTNDAATLRTALAEDGYLYCPNLLPRKTICQARQAFLDYLDAADCLQDGWTFAQPIGKGHFTGRKQQALRGDTRFMQAVESPLLFTFFAKLFNEPALSFDFKWIRAVEPGNNTAAHMDHVYMGRGSQRLLTAWTPLGDIPMRHGSLALLEDSHKSESLAKIRRTYGRMDVDRDRVGNGWFDKDLLGLAEQHQCRWLSSDFAMGDILIFGMHMMHASTRNDSNHLRLSCDIRFQPASEPTDTRWIGAEPPGHDQRPQGEQTTMSEARAAWGV